MRSSILDPVKILVKHDVTKTKKKKKKLINFYLLILAIYLNFFERKKIYLNQIDLLPYVYTYIKIYVEQKKRNFF